MDRDSILEEEKRRREFRDILYSLAIHQDSPQRYDTYKRLENVYWSAETHGCGFRHFYSDIFSVLTKIRQDPSLGSIETIGINIEDIRRKYQPCKNSDENGNPIDVSESIQKLYDHVSLDIARLNYTDGETRAVTGESALSEISKDIESSRSDIRNMENNLKKMESKVQNQQREYIAILGIFSAVVLAFTAGIAFSGSVLENIASSSIYRVIFAALIIGLVIIDILYMLFAFIERVVNGKTSGIRGLIIVNVIILALIVLVFLCWNYGIVETRDLKFDSMV